MSATTVNLAQKMNGTKIEAIFDANLGNRQKVEQKLVSTLTT